MHDIIIVGGGAAGLTAALYALRSGKSVLVIEKSVFGGQITYSPKVENYPGIPQMSGNSFAEQLLGQVLALGAEIELDEVIDVESYGEYWRVETPYENYDCRAVILATGAKHRMLGLEGESGLVGSGVSFCAVCDGEFYRGKDVVLAGGGNSALQEALMLADICASVTVVQDLDRLTGEETLQKQLYARSNVKVITGARVSSLEADAGELCAVGITHADGAAERIECAGLFVAIGLVPENEPFAAIAPLDERGYISAGEDCTTPSKGIFVAGDCRAKQLRQLTTACADGSAAAVAACRYIDSL